MWQFIIAVWQLLCQMAPFLLLGFAFAALLYAFVPPTLLNRLTGGGVRSVFVASVIGTPLPLCSCSVLPTALAFRERGASDGATASFLIATPITSVDSVAVTYAFFGWFFAVFRLLASLVVAILVGLVSHTSSSSNRPRKQTISPCQFCKRFEEHRHGFGERVAKGLSYGFQKLPYEIGRWILLGIVFGGLLTVVLPKETLVRYAGSGVLPLLVMLGVGIPLYVCSTGSVPIAAALVSGGFSVGSALVFLLVGPATNLSAILALWRVLGRRFILVYLLTLIITAFMVGYLFDAVFAEIAAPAITQKMRMELSLFDKVSALALLGLLLGAHLIGGLKKTKKEDKKHTTENMKTGLLVKDLKCEACATAIRNALLALEGVDDVSVDLKTRLVQVYHSSPIERKILIDAVRNTGYRVD